MNTIRIHYFFLANFSFLALMFHFFFNDDFIDNNLYLLLFCLFLILSIGISHGALDNMRGKKILLPMLKNKWYLLFYPCYISLILIVIISWVSYPNLTLLLFLLVASYHFGEEDLSFFLKNKGILFNFISFLKGFLIITLSFHFNYETTTLFFDYLMVPEENYKFLTKFKSILFSTNLILATLGIIYLFKSHIDRLTSILFEILVVTLSFMHLPLIFSFTLYFCFLHSSKHIISLSRKLDPSNHKNGLKLFFIKAIPLTLLTAVTSILTIYFLGDNLNKNIIQIIFIGLASLTLPHIILEVLGKKNE